MIASLYVIFCLSLVYCNYATERLPSSNYEECQKRECKLMASEYLGSIDKSVDPCDDFYAYVCSGWMSFNYWRSKSWDPILDMESHLTTRITNLLTRSTQKSFTKAKAIHLYKGCKNLKGTGENNLRTLREMLNRVGGWPILGDRLHEHYDWMDAIATAYKEFDVEILVSFGYEYRYSGEKPRTLLHMQPSNIHDLIISKDADKNKLKKFYKTLIKLSVEQLNSSIDEKTIMKDIDGIIKLEEEIIKRTRNRSINDIVSLGKFQLSIDGFVNITSYFTKIFDGAITETDDRDIAHNTYQIMRTFARFITEAAGSVRPVANYIGWKIVRQYIEFTTTKLVNKFNKFQRMNKIFSEHRNREDFCASVVRKYLPNVVSGIFEEAHHYRLEKLEEVVKGVKHAFFEVVNKSNWIDEESRNNIKKKLEHLKIQIGSPNWILNKSEFEYYYRKLGNITQEKPLLGVLHARKFNLGETLSRMITPFENRKPIEDNLMSVSTIYNYLDNKLNINSGIIDYPAYHSDFPFSILFGTIGVMIAHEIGHSLDAKGISINEDSLARDILTETNKATFNDKFKCFKDHDDDDFEPLTLKTIPLDQTINDDILDSEAIRISFEAYKRHVSNLEAGKRTKLATADYTPDQLFFISHASLHCQVYELDFAETYYNTKRHNLNRFRVMWALSNSQEFYDAFNCTSNSEMYKENKCRFW